MILKEFDADNFHIIIYEPEVSKPQKISFETKSEENISILNFSNIFFENIILSDSIFNLLTSSTLHFSVTTPNNEFCFTDERGFYVIKDSERILYRIISKILI